jgi:hypothetical protein
MRNRLYHNKEKLGLDKLLYNAYPRLLPKLYLLAALLTPGGVKRITGAATGTVLRATDSFAANLFAFHFSFSFSRAFLVDF